MNFHRVALALNALRAHRRKEFTHLVPAFSKKSLSSWESHSPALYMHLMNALAALIVAWISRKMGLRDSLIAFRSSPIRDSRNSKMHTVSAPLNHPLGTWVLKPWVDNPYSIGIPKPTNIPKHCWDLNFRKVSLLGSHWTCQIPVGLGTTGSYAMFWTLWRRTPSTPKNR